MVWCRIFYRCVDWNILTVLPNYLFLGRIFYRCVDWNYSVYNTTDKAMSHLLQMRGLKPFTTPPKRLLKCRIFYRCVDWNMPVSVSVIIWLSRIFYRCVDWNSQWCWSYSYYRVASFTDAWIETFIPKDTSLYPQSHLLQMRGLKPKGTPLHIVIGSRIFYRCVDWNVCYILYITIYLSRIFYRCVDWNR